MILNTNLPEVLPLDPSVFPLEQQSLVARANDEFLKLSEQIYSLSSYLKLEAEYALMKALEECVNNNNFES